MWVPDSIQISKELITAELDRKVPVGTIVATAAFSMSGATKETAKTVVEKYGLTREAATVAWKFLQTGQIVTSDGEILTATSEAASPVTPVEPSRPTAPLDSVTTSVRDIFKKHFPDWVEPTTEQCLNLHTKSPDLSVIDNALYTMANGNTDIKNPITLLFWVLNNKHAEQIAQEREILEKKGVSSDSIVRRAMREADAMIPGLPTPHATEENTDLIRKMKEQVERVRK